MGRGHERHQAALRGPEARCAAWDRRFAEIANLSSVLKASRRLRVVEDVKDAWEFISSLWEIRRME